jgi:drug/metabolite transporter (DMT)-like permease
MAFSTSNRTQVGLLLVFAAALISGISTFVNLYAVQGTNSDVFVSVRNLVVVGLIAPIAYFGARAAREHLARADWARLALIGLIGGAIPFLLFFHGLQLAAAQNGGATASFVYRLLFLMATFLGIVFLNERFHWRVALAATLLLAGSLLLLSLTSPVWTDGTGYVFAATVLWAAEYTLSKRTMQHLTSGTVALGRMGFGAVFLFGYLAATTQLSQIGSLSGSQWEWVAISAILLAAFVATWYGGLSRVELGTATSVLVLGFLVTWVLTVAVRGSPFTMGQAAGAALVAAGVAVMAATAILYESRRRAVDAMVSPAG